jgi:nucleoside-diphosphate-sugar epimerase
MARRGKGRMAITVRSSRSLVAHVGGWTPPSSGMCIQKKVTEESHEGSSFGHRASSRRPDDPQRDGAADMSEDLVLVTGGSGFIGAHCVLALLASGYRVQTTVRSPDREPEVRAMLKVGGAKPGQALSFAVADLVSDVGWPAAVEGCDFVLHVASPLPREMPRHEEDLIVPARDGARRVLTASRDAGVKRVVLTSSFAAVAYGHEPRELTYSEKDWTYLGGKNLSAYIKAKTLAERAAWDFIACEGGALELAVVNPVVVLGPVLGPDYSISIQLVHRLIEGGLPGFPRLSLSVVDVRDVADLHLRAMIHPAAGGERFLASAGDPMSIKEIAHLLKSRLGDAGARIPTRVLPDWVLRLASVFAPLVRQALPELGEVRIASNKKAERLLGWRPRPNEEAILATAESLLRLGLVRRRSRRPEAPDLPVSPDIAPHNGGD